MRNIHFSLIVLLAIFGHQTSYAAQKSKPANGPDGVVRELYRVHNDGKGHLFEAKGKNFIYKFFDQKLADLLWKDISETPEGDGNLDFDPLYNAQDTQITRFQIAKPVLKGADASVLVSFLNFGQPARITFEMHQGTAGWKITNILYGDKSDIVKILTQ